MDRHLRSLIVGSALLVASLTASAAIVEGQTVNGRRYASGGIGQGEVEQMRQMSDKFSLQLIVSSRSGAYLADMQVSIIGANSQKVLDAPLDAPWLLVDLAPGTYKVFVMHRNGQSQERNVTIVGGKKTELVVQFDVTADTAKNPAGK